MLPLGGLFLGTELTPLFPNLIAGMTKKGWVGGVCILPVNQILVSDLDLMGSLGNPGLEIICLFMSSLKS